MFEATMDFTDETVEERIEAAADGEKLVLVRTTLPIVLLSAGAALLVLGLVLHVARAKSPAHART